MYKVSIFGIPAHPLVNDMPAALLPASLMCDTIALVGGGPAWARSGYHTLLLGTISGVAAGVLGALDVPLPLAQPETRNRALVHAGLNIGLMGLFGVMLFRRRAAPDRVSIGSWVLSLVGNLALNYSAWNGASLVYQDGLRVAEDRPTVPLDVYEEPARVA